MRWHQLSKTIEKMYPFYSLIEKTMVDDLMEYMDKLRLRDFSGISFPGKTLNTAFSSMYPVFYDNDNISNEKKTYFDQLKNLGITLKENIFYKGEYV